MTATQLRHPLAAMGDYRNTPAPDSDPAVDALALAVCGTGGHIPHRDKPHITLGGDVIGEACDFHRRMAAGYLRIVDAARLPDVDQHLGHAAHNPGQRTEIAAADLILPKAGTLRERALHALLAHGPMTDRELAEATDTYLYTIAPRRTELVRMGWVRDTGTTRTTAHHREAIVWELTPAARDRLTVVGALR